jgi:hypothetical protein
MTALVDGYHTDPGRLQARLIEIEEDLASRVNEYEAAAGDRARLIREWEKNFAVARVKAKGTDADARKAAALVAAADANDVYTRLQEAEGQYEAAKVAVNVLTTRASIGQSILRSQGRA